MNMQRHYVKLCAYVVKDGATAFSKPVARLSLKYSLSANELLYSFY